MCARIACRCDSAAHAMKPEPMRSRAKAPAPNGEDSVDSGKHTAAVNCFLTVVQTSDRSGDKQAALHQFDTSMHIRFGSDDRNADSTMKAVGTGSLCKCQSINVASLHSRVSCNSAVRQHVSQYSRRME